MCKVCPVLSCNWLKVSQKDQDLVRCLSIPVQSVTLMSAGTVFQEQAQNALQDHGWTSWSSLTDPPGTSSWNFLITLQSRRCSTIFEHLTYGQPCFLTARALQSLHLTHALMFIYPCFAWFPLIKMNMILCLGNTLLWEGSLVWPCLLAHNKVPSYKITLALSFGCNYWAFGPGLVQ